MTRRKGEAQSKLLCDLGEHFEIMKSLVHTVHALGGDDNTLKRLRREPELAARIGKLLVGRVWEFMHGSFDLEVDWRIPLKAILKHPGKGIGIHPDSWYDSCGYLVATDDEKPKKDIRYSLLHPAGDRTLREVQHLYDCASTRELHAFALKIGSFHPPVAILAPRSLKHYEALVDSDDPDHDVVPSLEWTMWEGKEQLVLDPIKARIGTRLRHNYFVLIRVAK